MGMLDYLIHRTNAGRERMRQRLLAGDVPHWIKTQAVKRAGNQYVAQVVRSCPPWVDREELRRIKERCQALSELTGVPYHVAHIVPLTHPRMCGLTVPWNLEPKPARMNLSESNHVQQEGQQELPFVG